MFGGPFLFQVLLGLFRKVAEKVVNGKMPVPKRGNLNVCDNWN